MVAMVHCEGGRSGGGEEVKVWSRLLCHAHLHLAVIGLETGYCRDIHGEVREWIISGTSHFVPRMHYCKKCPL